VLTVLTIFRNCLATVPDPLVAVSFACPAERDIKLPGCTICAGGKPITFAVYRDPQRPAVLDGRSFYRAVALEKKGFSFQGSGVPRKGPGLKPNPDPPTLT